MLLLNLQQPSLLLWTYIAQGAYNDPRAVSSNIYALVLLIACIGGTLHGVAMALRKYYGEGHAQYWLHWQWWLGPGVDAVAGFMIWPAMPYVPVQMLVPLIIVVQLGSSHLLGMFVFKERYSPLHNAGLVLAVAGVVGVSMSTPHHTAPFALNDFWDAWVTPRFLMANLVACSLLVGSYLLAHRTTFWALAAGVLEGVQYICSRTIVDSIVDYEQNFIKQPVVMAALCIKVSCIVLIIHFQQKGLESDLSRFAGIFLVSCTLFSCLYGTAFFGEAIHSSLTFIASSFLTLGGIWLLNQVEEIKSSDDELRKSPRESEIRLDDAAFEGATESA